MTHAVQRMHAAWVVVPPATMPQSVARLVAAADIALGPSQGTLVHGVKVVARPSRASQAYRRRALAM